MQEGKSPGTGLGTAVLKHMDKVERLTPEVVKELQQDPDLVLQATKQMVYAIDCSMANMVATERHLWLNLLEIKDQGCPIFCPMDIAVNVINWFQEAKKQ